MQSQTMLAVQQRTTSLNTGASLCSSQRVRQCMHCVLSRQRLPPLSCSAAVVTQPLAWRDIQHQAGDDVLRDYVIRRGQAPGTSPHPVVPSQRMTAPQSKPVLLWRDTNAWCPFCERVRTHDLEPKLLTLQSGCATLNQQHHTVWGRATKLCVVRDTGVDGPVREGSGV